MAVDLVRGGGVEPRVRPVVVVPGEIELQFPAEMGEPIRHGDEAPRALGLDGPDAAFDHCHAAVLADGPEPLTDPTTAAPALELPGDELAALVGEQMPGPIADAPEEALQKPPNCRGGGLATEDDETHDAPRAVVDGHGKPPAERPHLRQGKGHPRDPEAERGGHSREINVPEVIRSPGGDGAGVVPVPGFPAGRYTLLPDRF